MKENSLFEPVIFLIPQFDIVNNKLSINTESDDEADSVLIGIAYLNMFGG